MVRHPLLCHNLTQVPKYLNLVTTLISTRMWLEPITYSNLTHISIQQNWKLFIHNLYLTLLLIITHYLTLYSPLFNTFLTELHTSHNIHAVSISWRTSMTRTAFATRAFTNPANKTFCSTNTSFSFTHYRGWAHHSCSFLFPTEPSLW